MSPEDVYCSCKSWLYRNTAIIRNISVTVAAIVLIGFVYWLQKPPEVNPQPVPIEPEVQIQPLMGWAGPEVAKSNWEKVKGRFPVFRITNKQQVKQGNINTNKVVLWTFAKNANDGKHIPTFKQEVGDCVGMGAANAKMYLLAKQIALDQESQEFHLIHPSYSYGTSRAIGDFKIKGDGSLGSWAALAAQEYGCLCMDGDDVPDYSGKLSRRWGKSPGPEDRYIEHGQHSLVQSAARVNSANDVRDALVNGYPVTVASDQGFRMAGREMEGKLWGIPQGQWMHQMCFIGYDPVSCPRAAGGGSGAFYILNSWGPNAHGKPVGDEPPGGFWVAERIVEKMVRQGDSFAWSELEGFPQQEWDLDLLKDDGTKPPTAVKNQRVKPRERDIKSWVLTQ